MEKLTEEIFTDSLPDWNFSVLQDPSTLLHEAFEAQVDRDPGALAVVWEEERLTYQELDERANRLAAHLRDLGVGPEVPVGVCVERSAGLIVALLAVLKAGGAYVPLDPAYPVQRNTYTLDDSGAEVVLTQAGALGSLPPLGGRRAVLLDEQAAEIAARPAVRPERLSDAANLAYFIYTSGSTGRPKGVAIAHRTVVSLMRWCAEFFPPSDLAGVLASTSICFDISIFEMFAPLSTGGTMIVAANVLDVPYLRPDPPVTLISTVPSAMAELVRTRRVPPSVRVTNLGGEALPGSLVEEIYRTTGIERVYNVYGPSEDTTYSTYALIPRDSRIAPPVGDPLPGTSVWLLDEEGTPVPFGQEGEVHLTGAGISRGYHGRPELTAERFLPDPFSGEPGARMYRVGDLGRFLPDGQLHYVGRVDFQVKIRGFRIELGEVEDALMRHPAVREAAVMARGEVAEGKYLVAWLAVDGPMPEIAELRSFLALTLPHYMIPSRFVRVDALPRTLNGKVDRKALPDSEEPAGEDRLDGWRRELAGAATALDLPSDRPRPQVQSFRGAMERLPLPAGLTTAVTDSSGLLLAAFQALLWRLTGEPDFVVGLRPVEGGLLPLRSRPGDDPPFRELLARTRNAVEYALARRLPFEQLVAGLGLAGDPSRHPLFQAAISLSSGETAAAGLDLDLVVETGGEPRAALTYDATLFDPWTARRFLACFFTLLEGAVTDPALPLSELPLLAAAERHQLLVEWNDTEPPAPSGPALLRRLAEWARRSPGALAVAQGDRRATFGELDARAGRLAGHLRRLGIGPESLVAVCLPRSIETLVAFLAVWKAGGAYVPLDPSYPIDRLAFVLEDCGARVLIARGELADTLARPGVQVVDPDAGEEAEGGMTGELPPDGLAYVIYTSGSTGRPKGVAVSHRSLLNLVEWDVAAYGLGPADRTSLLARVGFDASVWETWPTLAAGASLHLPDQEALTDPERLRDWMVGQGITVAFLPTPLAELLVGLPWPGETALRAIMAGGDALHRRPAAGMPFRLVNHYGPTEATVVATAGGVAPEGAGEDRLPSIGRPLPGLRVHVLDGGLRLLPIGVPGDLAIGGVGLARGYLGGPAETASRYVPDPFSAAPGERLYRTGDLVRLRPDGEIEFLGRVDRQVKLRGFRLELGEIEAALARHPQVREAAVILAGGRLVAFLVPWRQPAPPAGEVLDFLAAGLPDYMVPSVLVPLPELPLSANGKIDRNALAARVPAEGTAEALATPEEERIAGVWREVLGVESVGPRDDFFRLGGHSLLAFRVIARLRQEFDVDLPVQTLFQAPTVEGLADAVAEALHWGALPERPPMLRDRRAAVLEEEVLEAAAPEEALADVAVEDLPALVARIWAEVLGLPAVDPQANFFDLGGHSLLGARTLARLRDRLGIDLPLRALFSAPTAEGLAAVLAEALYGGDRPAPGPAPGAAAAIPGERLPLSFGQGRFWLLDRLERGSAVYNIPRAYLLEGELDAAALWGSLAEIVRRHEALRTRFAEVSGAPYQEILPPSLPDLPRVDLGALPAARREEELERLGREEANWPFDLRRGPLLRFLLVHREAREHALLANFHHAVFDGWSLDLFEHELSVLYAAALEGGPSPLAELPFQYADYALWQRGWLTSEVQEKLLDWWHRELAGAPAQLLLPTDRPRPEVQAFRGTWERLQLPTALMRELDTLGRGERVTRFMVLLTAFQALLGALSGQEDLLIGSPASNRPLVELQGLIGVFVETVVLRARLGGDPSFRDLLAGTRESALGAFAHQDLPFERLVAGLQIQRSSARSPLIQTLFALEEAREELALTGLASRSLDPATATSKFDLSLFVKETADGLRADLEYDSDLFDPATARRFLSGFAGLLEAVVADPSRPLSALTPLAVAERRQIAAGPGTEVERIGAGPGVPPAQGAAPASSPRSSRPSRDMERIAQIWSEILAIPLVGPDDNFFNLGGHSLLGARMLARVHELFGVDLSIRELFQAPTVRALAERIAFLRRERPSLAPAVQRMQRGGLLPVSFVQESLWFLHLLDPASPVYNIPLAWRLRGALDAAALEAALGVIVSRHEVLRVSFLDVEGRPFLEVSPAAALPLPRIDLSGLPATLREAELERVARAEGGAPFDLGAGPLARFHLAVLGDADHVLVANLHHAVFDGSSLPIFGGELAALYQAATAGSAPDLPELRVQYADFAAWQRSWLRGGALGGLLDFWRDALAGAPTVLELPTDHPRPAVQTFRGDWEILDLPASLGGSLLSLGRHEGATAFMTLLAAFQALLYRLTGQPDLLVGAPVANRSRPELEVLIGYFVDTVVLRASFRGGDTFRRRIERTREASLHAIAHQELPFTLLAAELEAGRDPSRNPLFQVLFALDAPAQGLNLPGVTAQPLFIAEPAAKFDLSLGIQEDQGALSLNLEYNRDLFDPATARRILASLAVLMEAVAVDPDRRLDDIALLSASEVRQLAAAADRATAAPVPRRLHDLFAAQAARLPEALAVLTPAGESLTYAGLAGRSRRIARFLAGRGVGPEVPVGVCLERSPDLVAALLGVLEAGGVYLPLDPDYPADRLAWMLEDSGARLVLTCESLEERIPAGAWRTARLEDLPATGEAASEPAGALPESLAYLVYTSGSTGRPKGVGVAHAAAAEHVADAAAGMFGCREGDRMLWFSSPSFDMSLEEVLVPLATGGAVVLREAELWPPAELVDHAARLGVTLVDMPTAYWHQWAAEAERLRRPADLALRRVVLGGEAMSGEALRRWLRSPFADVPVINSYGPTETVITSTALAVDAALVETAGGVVPIGHPLAGRSAWVLDGFGHPVPPGVAGELCVGGPLLARGYLGSPGVTAERFVPDPFTGLPGSRLYRTGDLVRSRPDGTLEFLGRVDRQIKVRGFRVELGEVESALARHPGVREAVVDARPDPAGQRLVAWIVPAGPAPVPAELSGFLRGFLPEPMVPTAFVTLAELPLTPNGKVNLRALPEPEASATAAVEPRTPTEARLAELWRELLGASRISIHDSFFSLGGHSLLAIRLLSRLRDVFGVNVPVRSLFAAPTLAAMAALVDSSPREGEPEMARRPALPVLPAAEPAQAPLRERLPLSFSQRSLWLVERLQPAGAAYNLPMALRLGGPLDVAALATALGGVIERHSALRTRFVEIDGEPWQELLPAAVPGLTPIALGPLPAERREREAEALARAEFTRPFDLAAGPLLRARLFRLDADDHLFVLVVHHAVSDGWSDGVILKDLAALYQAAVEGRPPGLPEPLQFADYTLWQRQHLQGPVLDELVGYWRERLAGVPVLELPTDHRRPSVWSFRGAVRTAPLEAVSAGLERLARKSGATPFMVLLAAAQVLLGRYSSQSDFAVGTPTASRTRSEMEDAVGFFVNMLPLRADLTGAPTFRALLDRVRATVLEAFTHQALPFELLVEKLAPERDLGRNPIFQVVLQLLYTENIALPGLVTRRVDPGDSAAKFDLNFFIERRGEDLAVACEYAVDLFDAPTVQRLLDQFELLIAGAAADPGRAIGDLPLLSPAERHHLLTEVNDVPRAWPREATIHGLFEEAAARTPDAVAVVFEEQRLTYRELDDRSGRLAARLVALGVRPEDRVALLVERSLEMMVALLAVLKAGGAYAPIDPSLPAERMAYLLGDLHPPVLLVQEKLRSRIPGDLAAAPRVVSLDGEPLPEEPLSSRPFVTADSLAYVLYTSGSTGRPKGVACVHRSVVRLVKGEVGYADLGPERTLLQLTALTFDPSVVELWGPLTNGGRLVIFPPGVPTFEKLEEVIAGQGVDTVWLTTGLFHQVVDERPGALAPIRQLLAGGDVLSPSHVRRAIQVPPAGRVLVNGYGPTESTLFTTCQAMWSPGEVREPVAIGRPVNGTRVYVLDRGFQPAPFGAPGELYIGGDGLARGYDGRPDLTAERFVPDPFAGSPGERLYRTGDLVRLRPSGEMDFLGRLDFQVKVRGFRIELGEIDATLDEHPAVQQSAVVVRQDARGDKHLVAYVAVPGPGAATAEDLRSFLARKLPAYMVPSTFVLLPSLPLSTHGKVDRHALPEPDLLEERDFTAPRNATEELLAALWREVLGVERIGVHENFFSVGGHSLRAVQLVSRLRQAFGVDLGVHVLFSAPTIAELAEAIERARGEESRRLLPPIRPVPRGARLPVSFPQQRLWFVERLAPDRATYNIPLAYRLRGRLYPAALAAALGELVHRHETLRTRFVELDGQPWQEILPPAPFRLPVIDLSALPAAQRERALARVGHAEAGAPFDLTADLMRTRLIRLGEREHVFLITLHHIAFDGWSEEVMRRELSALYAAALTGQPVHLSALRVQYADFAAWQRSWPESVLAEQLAYWTGRLGGVATLEIPTDRPRPPVQTFRGGIEPFTIGREVGAALHALVEERGVTLFMVMLASWQTLLHRVSGQADVAVGSPVANRTRSEIEGLIGFFVNMLAFRTDFGGDPSFADMLARLRRTALEAYDHADVPFERLVDELRLERDLSRNPVVQVMFALQATGADELRLPGLALERIDFTVPVAKFDLTLWLQEEAAGDFGGWIEYNADLFDRASMARLVGHLGSVLAAVAARPEEPVSSIELLTPHERRQILEEWNDTRTAFPESVLIHQFFEAQVDRAPGALAAVWEDRSVTYGELEARSNRLARLLRRRGLERGAPVGVWMERSIDMLAGVLGVLKVGGYYLPLDPAWPAERVESILGTCDAPAILTRSAHLGPVLEMQWRLPLLSEVICLDVETAEPAPEAIDAGSIRAVFDLVAEAAVDRVTAGGFVSSYTGEPFSDAEVDEYRDRVLSLAAPWIGPGKRVLEIGSGSGLILWEIAPRVARAVGLDASALTQERNRERAAELGLAHVELPVGFAHEIAGWPEGSFDLVILASTIQFFPGPLYLEKIVADALRLLTPGGGLVIADVPDARRQEELRRTVEEQRALRGLPTRQDAPKILSVDEDLFRDLAALPEAGEVAVRHRESGFANELGFRYDVVLTRGDQGAETPRRKRLWTSWHVEREAADRLPAVASPEDLAYIIHTSGSTGQPKGIAVQHRPVANLFAWLNPAFGIGPDDRVLFVTSLCFDLSVYDIFGLLAAGGCVHVASEEDLRDAERLTRMLVEEPVTLWDSAPAALVRLAPLFPGQPAVHSRLRRVMLSGDWIPVTLPDRVRAAFPHAVVTSLGGATEATVWSNFYPIGEVDPNWPSIPYGRPIDNARYHVLDAGLLPCPIGVPGDLYIGGEVLCVGYSYQPAVTAAAFIPDPFSEAPGARIYRTGDRARWFADGNLEFLGRVDQQVKIRGFRIELGEIEVALSRHPGLREAVVLAREDVPGDKRLVAYVVPAAGAAAPSALELREFLRHGLPDYMIPAAFVELDHLPVTANGKLDRRALPAPRWDHAGEEGEIELPVTATERLLAGLWSEILGVDPVGRGDDFFDLGGHSLLATQLVARLREVFGVEVPLRVVFQAPSLAELATEIDALMEELAERVEQGTAPAPSGPTLRPVPREGALPLSASQLRQWFLVQLDPASAAYNLPVTVQLDGDLRVDVLAAALREIVRRHEALRTTFDSAGGRPYAVIAPALELPLPVADLSALPAAAREAEAWRLAGEDLDRPFDLVHGPVLRTSLLRYAPDAHVLVVTFHHIAFDGSSLGVFLRELAALYEAFAAGRPSPLPELPVQYVDYAAWQREWMEGPGFAEQLGYWKRQLTGAPRVLDLPADRPRPAVQSHEGRLMRMESPPSLAAGLRTLTSREGVTLFMAVLAGYATVLGRYTGQDDLNIGSFVANRRHEALERQIGFFVNTLVLRADLSGDPTFRELLARTREMTLDAFERQEVPFEQLLDELSIERDASRTPLFQVMIGVQNFAVPSIRIPGLALQTIGLTDKERSTTDLSLYLWEEEGVMTSWLEFSTDLFDVSTMERLYGHLGTLLTAAEADPGLRLSELPLMPEAERRQVLDWSVGEVPAQTGRPVHERMREQARRAPEAPAVSAGGRVLTYGELDRRAGRVARGLRRLGVGPETVVGLCVDRSPEMIVGLFGILGAGAAYLPLDPGLPADRLALLAGSSGVPVVLTRRELAPGLPELPARLLRVDADFEAGFEADGGEGLPEIATAPESAAYVLYTSGSTGTPKGVVVEHRALGSFVDAAIATYEFNREDRVLQFASLAFDTSVEEIYPCLAVGGTLVLRDEEMLASPARFLSTCREAGITVLDLPTAWWHELSAWVERERPTLPVELRLIILGGERALPERVRGWLAATGGIRPWLFNSYGPTEGTVVATACDLDATAPAVPIGRPLPGVEVYLLDPELRPVPAGVPGEICLGGADLARGYLGRPDLTAERFVPSPFGPAGARLYRTGDLGRWRADGQLDFAGRVDDQVKIRGFRIEPGEVAAALARHPAIQEAVAVAHEVRPGERELTAYAVPAQEPWPEVAELRAFLKEVLPAYMIPSGLVLLAAMPRTATGKVDRRALPEPGREARHDREYAAPETPTEEILAGIWQELLGVEPVGIYDNFFDLGGHSLLAPQVISRVGETFEIELPLRVLFEAPTIAQMANAVEQILLAQIEELSDEEIADLVGDET